VQDAAEAPDNLISSTTCPFNLFVVYQSGSVIPAISRNAMYAVDLIQRFMVDPLISCSPLQPKKLDPPLRLV